MNVTVDLTRLPPEVRVHLYRDGETWFLEWWPNEDDASEWVLVMADSAEDIVALGEAITDAGRAALHAAESGQASILGRLGDEVATDSGQSETEAL